jgi:hypothetical protein
MRLDKTQDSLCPDHFSRGNRESICTRDMSDDITHGSGLSEIRDLDAPSDRLTIQAAAYCGQTLTVVEG